ncbi:Adenosine deaminase/editase [Amanita muscaria]
MTIFDDAVRSLLDKYASLSYEPPHNQFTVLAAFFLYLPDSSTHKVISLATGTKCLPTVKLPTRGEALHDSHAEVVARRAAVRWFLEEIGRCHDSQPSQWITWDSERRRYSLHAGVQLNLYISTLPCGDASTRFLAATQDDEMARLKDSAPTPPSLDLPAPALPLTISRGRDGYSLLGVLRTKPGRADSPATICMSCSDKIASWNVHGIQGALGSLVLEPLYINTVIIGEVLNPDRVDNLRRVVEEDCERGLWARVADVHHDLPDGFSVHKPTIHFTSLPFVHSRTELTKLAPDTGPTNESLCWVAERSTHEVLINGLKRGVSPKHRFRDKSRPLVCKHSMYQLVHETLIRLAHPGQNHSLTYFEFKREPEQYQKAKDILRGPGSPFSGWLKSGIKWEGFDLEGQLS